MNLNKRQEKLIQDRLKSVWKGKRECYICTNTQWCMGSINETKEYNEGNHCPGAGITPLVQIHCATCGYTLLFNAIALGVVDRDTGIVKEAE